MRTWVKVTIASVSVVVLGFGALASTSAYFFLRHLDTRSTPEAEAVQEFEGIRSRFKGRTPLIEVDPQTADIRIHRPVDPDGRPVTTLHLLTWDAEDDELFRTELPLWLMRFSTLNVLSKLGIAPEKFRLTVQDIERYGPGIVIDYSRPGQKRALIWVE